ncbi:PepSY domain-containing protein [Niallia endozanthoxylica]|nr:PepSY domain-containing protein [Niallia endozanthoxylica]
MKGKILIGFVCTAVVLGGSFAAVAAKNQDNTLEDQNKKEFITLQDAETIALKEVNGTVESIDLETKVGKSYYEVEIEKDHMDYDIYIDAVTGEPYSIKQDDKGFDDDKFVDQGKSTNSAGTAISETEAVAIAEKAVNGKMVEIEKEHDDGILKYQLELRTDRGEAEVDIDAHTGKIIEIEYDDED